MWHPTRKKTTLCFRIFHVWTFTLFFNYYYYYYFIFKFYPFFVFFFLNDVILEIDLWNTLVDFILCIFFLNDAFGFGTFWYVEFKINVVLVSIETKQNKQKTKTDTQKQFVQRYAFEKNPILFKCTSKTYNAPLCPCVVCVFLSDSMKSEIPSSYIIIPNFSSRYILFNHYIE